MAASATCIKKESYTPHQLKHQKVVCMFHAYAQGTVKYPLPGIELALSVELAPPVWARLQAQFQQQAVIVCILMCADIMLLQHSLIGLKQLQQCHLQRSQVFASVCVHYVNDKKVYHTVHVLFRCGLGISTKCF